MGHNPLVNPIFWCLFLPLTLVWGYVSLRFFLNWMERRNYVSLMLAFMPLGYLLLALRELHLLGRLSTVTVLCASLAVGNMTAWVVHQNSKARGPNR